MRGLIGLLLAVMLLTGCSHTVDNSKTFSIVGFVSWLNYYGNKVYIDDATITVYEKTDPASSDYSTILKTTTSSLLGFYYLEDIKTDAEVVYIRVVKSQSGVDMSWHRTITDFEDGLSVSEDFDYFEADNPYNNGY